MTMTMTMTNEIKLKELEKRIGPALMAQVLEEIEALHHEADMTNLAFKERKSTKKAVAYKSRDFTRLDYNEADLLGPINVTHTMRYIDSMRGIVADSQLAELESALRSDNNQAINLALAGVDKALGAFLVAPPPPVASAPLFAGAIMKDIDYKTLAQSLAYGNSLQERIQDLVRRK